MSAPATPVQPRGRLFWKYLVFLLVLVGAILVASSLVDLYFSYAQVRRALFDVAQEKAQGAAARIERFVLEIERQVRSTTHAEADDPAVALPGGIVGRYRETLAAALAEQRELAFLRLLRSERAITEIRYLDVGGKEQLLVSRAALDAAGSGRDFSNTPAFAAARSGKTYFSPVYLREGREPHMTIAVPSGEYAVEVTVAEINLRSLWDIISRIRVGQAGYAYVVDSAGHIVAHPNAALMLERLDVAPLYPAEAARADGAGPRPDRKALMLASRLGGGQMLSAHAAIASPGWTVYAEQPMAEALAPLQATIARSLVILALGLAASALASILLARRMVAPIRTLQTGAARIGAGQLGHRIDLRTGDELQALGEEFNRSAEQLEAAYLDLEAKVAARTRELAAANRELTETLAQQTAAGEILRLISRSRTDAQPVFELIARHAATLCGATYSTLYRFDGQRIQMVAQDHWPPAALAELQRSHPRPASDESLVARAILERAAVNVPDIEADASMPELSLRLGRSIGFRALLAVPVLREAVPVGAIAVLRATAGAFSAKQVEVLEVLAEKAAIALENARFFDELQARTGELTRSVAEMRALGEIGRAVSSTLDLDAVLSSIVAYAVQLSGADGGTIYEYDEGEDAFVPRANYGTDGEFVERLRRARVRLEDDSVVARAAALRAPAQIPDIAADEGYRLREIMLEAGYRSLAAAPFVRENRVLGGLVVRRRQAGEFPEKVLALLQTFADESAVAIHNARLFNEVQRRKRYFEALVEASPVAIATLDPGKRVVSWNTGAERLFGIAADEALGREIDELTAAESPRRVTEAAASSSPAAGVRNGVTSRHRRRDGTLVDVEAAAVPVIVAGREVGHVAVYHDVTELLRARHQAEAANEAKSAFLATMSHEIRTPMNAVIGMSGLLLDTPLDSEQRDFARTIRDSGDALLTIINDILDFSKIEAGRMDIEAHPFDLRECLESALDLVAARAAEKHLDLAYVFEGDVPEAVCGDVTRLRQVLLNLLSNAVKFTEAGEVVVSVSARSAQLHIAVRDTGIGLSEEGKSRLFRSFSQADSSTTRKYGGTGLGLAISKRLCELMGGTMWAESDGPGHGSTFHCLVGADAAERPEGGRRVFSGEQPALKGKRILVVDDNSTNRRILARQCATWGLQVQDCESPEAALRLLQCQPFDLAITDMHMPGMDGIGLARCIREQGHRLPLVLFTSVGRREPGDTLFAATLAKPLHQSQLFDTLVALLTGNAGPGMPEAARKPRIDAGMAGRHPLRILLAEDNAVNQKLALRLLQQMGYRADLARNGIEAIESVDRQIYDVVLMDVQMPEMDGLEASRRMRERWRDDERPRIIAMTANAMEGDREECLAAGMDDYLTKPIRVDELVAALLRANVRAASAQAHE